MDFTKRFNIGLTLQTDYQQFAAFLQDYHPYIHSVFFSVPVSPYFHSRRKIMQEFSLPGKKQLFVEMLKLLKSYGIELELLFNTLYLNRDLIGQAADWLRDNEIDVDSVCFIHNYYDAVCEFFPGKKYILSFNNGYQRKEQLDRALEAYQVHAVVLGGIFIRNNRMFAYLQEKGVQTYLLLNNACSFNCDTCNNVQSVCERPFQENLKKYPVEYLFALQSIFPHELRDGTIDPSNIACFKISNRSSDLTFLKNAMDSFLTGRVDDYVKADKNNYAIWGRAGFFWKYFKTMELETIRRHKEEILKKDASERIEPLKRGEG